MDLSLVTTILLGPVMILSSRVLLHTLIRIAPDVYIYIHIYTDIDVDTNSYGSEYRYVYTRANMQA